MSNELVFFSSIFAAAGFVTALPTHALVRYGLRASILAATVAVAVVVVGGTLLLSAYPHGNLVTEGFTAYGRAIASGFSVDRNLEFIIGVCAAYAVALGVAGIVGLPFVAVRSRGGIVPKDSDSARGGSRMTANDPKRTFELTRR